MFFQELFREKKDFFCVHSTPHVVATTGLHYYGYGRMSNGGIEVVHSADLSSSFGVVVVLRVSRGCGSKALEERALDLFGTTPRRRERAPEDNEGRPYGGGRCVVLHRHYKAWCGLVAIARDLTIATEFVTIMEVHAVVHGTPPEAEFTLSTEQLDGGQPTTTSSTSACVVVKSVPSNIAGTVSLLRIRTPVRFVGVHMNMKKYQLRQLLANIDHPVAGKCGGAVQLKRVKLAMAVTRLELSRRGETKVFSIEVPVQLEQILEKEARFYEERHGAAKRSVLRAMLARGLITASDFNSAAGRLALQRTTETTTNSAIFDGHLFTVNEHVMRPKRGTEMVVARAAELHSPSVAQPRILDLGTGSGCILISLLLRLKRQSPVGVGIDVSPQALAVARENAARLGMSAHSAFAEGTFAQLPAHIAREQFTIIVANPPYLTKGKPGGTLDKESSDPALAMFAPQTTPTLFYSQVLDSIEKRSLRSSCGGVLVLEACKRNHKEVVALVQENPVYEHVRMQRDEGGRVRVVEATWGTNLYRTKNENKYE